MDHTALRVGFVGKRNRQRSREVFAMAMPLVDDDRERPPIRGGANIAPDMTPLRHVADTVLDGDGADLEIDELHLPEEKRPLTQRQSFLLLLRLPCQFTLT